MRARPTFAFAVALAVACLAGQAEGSDRYARLTEIGAALVLDAALPVTPDQARQIVALLDRPDTVVLELSNAVGAVLEGAAKVPGALVEDVLNAGTHLPALGRALIADGRELPSQFSARRQGLFRHTLSSLHRWASVSLRADLLRRLIHPDNATARLAIVVVARANGVPLEAADLDTLRLTVLDPNAPDLAPALARALNRLAAAYGRDAVRLVLAPGGR